LEEVSALADRLEKQVTQGKLETLETAKKVNDYQAKMKEATKQMMALVSELSMHQATAMSLQQEKLQKVRDAEFWRFLFFF
jgi:predicted  nucleic acid-binding Zn-ribbon protein